MNYKIKRIALIGVFSALAYVFVLIGRIPISSVEFLKYDPKDIVVAICGFILGPLPALIVTVVSSLIEMLTISETGFIGLVMNILSTAAFALPASFIYTKKRKLSGAVYGLICGVLLMAAVMLLWNYLITPIYMGMPRDAIADMLLPVFLPFNIIKGGLNAAFTMLLYKPVVTAMRKAHLIEDVKSDGKIKIFNVWTVIISLFVIAVCVLCVLAIKNII